MVLSAIPPIVLGAAGLYQPLIGLITPGVASGAVAGVGIPLTKVGFDYIRERVITGTFSTLTGVVVFLLTSDLAVVVVTAIVAGSLAARYLGPRSGEEELEEAPEPE